MIILNIMNAFLLFLLFLPVFIIVGTIIGLLIHHFNKKHNDNIDRLNNDLLEQEQLERNARFISARTSYKDN